MNTAAWVPLAVAAVGLIGIVVQQWRQRPVLRDQIKADLEIWTALPDKSATRDQLLRDVDARVQRLLKDEAELRRDPSGMTLGILMTVLFGWLTWWVWSLGGYFRLLEVVVIPLALIGLFGYFDSVRRVRRDERGRAQRRSKQEDKA